jgi:taurine dioxygenase
MADGARYERIRVVPTIGALGAEIHGVQLAQLDDATFVEIHRAWLEHQVVFFREQRITPAQQVAFARRLGELDTYPFIRPLPDHPEVIPIIKEPDNRFNFGGGWHSDGAYMREPPKATMLYALEVPTTGGDTLFASMYAAWEALSPGMKALLDGLVAVFTASKVHGDGGFYKKADHPMEKLKDQETLDSKNEHPVVRTHPETGRKALYVSMPHTERLKKMTTEESRPLLDFLVAHATKAEHTTRFQWRAGSLALWDNRAVQHYALNDYPGQRREMHRITIKGDQPR